MCIAVGSTLWYFDSNHRVYDPEAGHAPIYRKHWVEMKVIGETSRSWLVGHAVRPTKLAKKDFAGGARPHGWATTQGQVDQDIWIHENRYNLSVGVQRCDDYEKLRSIKHILEEAWTSSTGCGVTPGTPCTRTR